ncbi:type VI secretion protein VasK, partial [Pseudomonas gingeri]|nr:type VI secretion protein VasK [Pseudomonas gingeri]NWA17166.1 type VI secretion protein VasK [Pseudomonas gingeri]NWA59091.1 type VI secretion protein VasK [Pseudomonas gingeri]
MPFAWHTLLLLALIVAVLVVIGTGAWWLWAGPWPASRLQLQDILFKALLGWALLFALAALSWRIVLHGLRKLVIGPEPLPTLPPAQSDAQKERSRLLEHLRDRHGPFWRRKVRVLLVVGEHEQIEALAPGLSKDRWQQG